MKWSSSERLVLRPKAAAATIKFRKISTKAAAATIFFFSTMFYLAVIWEIQSLHKLKVDDDSYLIAPKDITSTKGSVWEDLDLSYAVTCGGFKCFVRSVSDKKIGYLIARDISIFDDMMKAMQLAKELKHMYGAKHFYIEPPYNASMPAETMAQLNTVAQQPLKELAQRHDFFSLPSVIVQKMKTAETPSLFFACFHPNYGITSANLPSFLSLVVETGDKEEFEINIAKERKILRSMLQDVPGFGADIQALVSTKGELFYIDLDAHMYWSHRRNSVFRNGVPLKKCEEKFDAIDRVLRKTTLDAATAYS